MRTKLELKQRIKMLLEKHDPACYRTHCGMEPALTELQSEYEAEIARLSAEREKERRVEQCCECNVYVSDWVEAEHRNGRICRPCESLISVRATIAERDRQLAEVELTIGAQVACIEGLENELADSQRQKAEMEGKYNEIILATHPNKRTQMSDQTDRTSGDPQADDSYTGQIATLKALLALRDEETARLKEESKRRLDGWTQAEQDLKETADQLRARLAEAMTGRVESSEIICDHCGRSCGTISLPAPALDRQLALESQCQRMRDALTNIRGWVIANTKTPAHNVLRFTGDALSDPLDLELLNAVIPSVQLNQAHTCSVSCTRINGEVYKHSDECVKLTQLLKSLSPAP